MQVGWGPEDQQVYDSLWAEDGSPSGAERARSHEGASSSGREGGSSAAQPDAARTQGSNGRMSSDTEQPGPSSSSNGSVAQRQRPPTVLVANKVDIAGNEGLPLEERLPPEVPRLNCHLDTILSRTAMLRST